MNEAESRQMGKDCIKVIIKKMSNQITPEEYYSELMELHRKYPMFGHSPEFSPFHFKNYKEIEILEVHPKNPKLKYKDHLRPYNFREAAEMYIRSRPNSRMVTDFKRRASEPIEREPGQEG